MKYMLLIHVDEQASNKEPELCRLPDSFDSIVASLSTPTRWKGSLPLTDKRPQYTKVVKSGQALRFFLQYANRVRGHGRSSKEPLPDCRTGWPLRMEV
jgi:hypothetical protein